jgi:glutathione S-transferase
MVLKLYGLQISGGVTPILALCVENDIQYQLIDVNLRQPGKEDSPELKEVIKINPMHCIPTIDDDGFTMYQNNK